MAAALFALSCYLWRESKTHLHFSGDIGLHGSCSRKSSSRRSFSSIFYLLRKLPNEGNFHRRSSSSSQQQQLFECTSLLGTFWNNSMRSIDELDCTFELTRCMCALNLSYDPFLLPEPQEPDHDHQLVGRAGKLALSIRVYWINSISDHALRMIYISPLV